MRPESPWTKLGRQAMAHAMTYPLGNRRLRNLMGGEPQDQYFRKQLWRSRIVLHHSRELAEQVLDGVISLGKAFKTVRPSKVRRQKRQEIVPPQKLTPSLPALKSMQSTADEIDPAELKKFLQIFAAPEA